MVQAHKDLVLITGGSGFIGQMLAKRLNHDYKVVLLDLEPPKDSKDQQQKIDFETLDLASEASIDQALGRVRKHYGNKIASVIHLAAYYSFEEEDSPKYEELTVKGVERLMQALQYCEVEQFVFSSTMLVHAPCEIGERITETSPIKPKWAYPKSKVQAEEVIKAKHRNIPYVFLRIAGVYDDHCHSIPIAHQIERIYEHHMTSHLYPANLDKGQSFVHVNDLVDAIHRVVDRRSQLPADLSLLIGEPETLSYGEMQAMLGELIHGDAWKTLKIPKAMAQSGAWIQGQMPMTEAPFIKPWMVALADDHYALDISRAQELLDWEPKRRLAETLPKMVSELKARPRTFYRNNKLSEPTESAVWIRSQLPKALLASAIGISALVLLKKNPWLRALAAVAIKSRIKAGVSKWVA